MFWDAASELAAARRFQLVFLLWFSSSSPNSSLCLYRKIGHRNKTNNKKQAAEFHCSLHLIMSLVIAMVTKQLATVVSHDQTVKPPVVTHVTWWCWCQAPPTLPTLSLWANTKLFQASSCWLWPVKVWRLTWHPGPVYSAGLLSSQASQVCVT